MHTPTHTLNLHILTSIMLNRSQYVSALYGDSLIYEITGEEPRVIISNEEKGTDVVVSKATVLTEYLVTFRVSHLLLLRCFGFFISFVLLLTYLLTSVSFIYLLTSVSFICLCINVKSSIFYLWTAALYFRYMY